MVIVRMGPNTGWTEDQQPIEFQNGSCHPRFSQNCTVIVIMVYDKQSYYDESANAATDDANKHRKVIRARDNQANGIASNRGKQMPPADPFRLGRKGFGSDQQFFRISHARLRRDDERIKVDSKKCFGHHSTHPTKNRGRFTDPN